MAEETAAVAQIKEEIEVEYNCVECNSIFTFESELRKHLETHKKDPEAVVSINLDDDVEASDSKLQKKDVESPKIEQPPTNTKVVQKRGNKLFCVTCNEYSDGNMCYLCWKLLYNPLSFDCEQCDKKFARKEQLKKHKTSSHKKTIYPCDKCNKTFQKQGLLYTHQKTDHQRVLKSLKCNLCKLKFPSQLTLKNHELNHGVGLKCQICAKKFELKVPLDSHLRKFHEYKELIDCDVCLQKFENMFAMFKHRLSHTLDEINNAEESKDVQGQGT